MYALVFFKSLNAIITDKMPDHVQNLDKMHE